MTKRTRTILITVFTALLVLSLAAIVKTQTDAARDRKIYQDAQSDFFSTVPTETSALPSSPSTEATAASDYTEPSLPPTEPSEPAPTEPTEPAPTEPTEPASWQALRQTASSVIIDFAGLIKKNPEVTGWIWIPDTTINFPVVQAENNQKYLKLSYDLKSSSSGSIFTDYRNSPDFSDLNTIIYGHNMRSSGAMFGGLLKYLNEGYISEHPYIYLFTPERAYVYRIFASYVTPATSDTYRVAFSSSKPFDRYAAGWASQSSVDAGFAPDGTSPVLTLSTCTMSASSEERVVVQGQLLFATGD